ncbi:MAG: YecA family protein [Anaerolineae bacterium]
MSKLGRNDPCYCGSGKKYKQCHLKIDQAAEREQRAWREAARFLRRDLLKFARDDRFAEDFSRALPLYWDSLYELDNAEEMSQDEALRFFDWFVFDFQPEDGPRLIEIYHAEQRESLSKFQQVVLDEWVNAPPADAYELTGYEGQTLHLRNFTTGETVEVYEPGGHGNVQVGEVILIRLVPVQERLEFSTTAAYLPAAEITDLADKLAAARTADAEAHPDATHEAFMRRNNTLLIHHALAEAKEQGRPPVARLNPNRPDKKTQAVMRKAKRLRR